MRARNKMIKTGILALAIGLAITGCEKIDQPALGPYPTDSNPPGGPLKFYTAYDGINADSIRAVFPNTDSATSFIGGVSGQAVQFNPVLKKDGSDSSYSFLVYPNANDFAATATSFSFSLWLNCPLDKKDNVNAGGIFALASTSSFWGNITAYTDHPGGPSDSMVFKIHFANGAGDNWDFANYTGANMIPKMYDGEWHQLTFTYDATTLTGILYRDGVQFDKKTNETIVFDHNATSLIVAGFEQAAGINGTYGDNGWMSGFPGAIDQLKFYAEALTPEDVASSFANKD